MVVWSRVVGYNERLLEFGCVLKVRLIEFFDELDVRFERNKENMDNYNDFGWSICLCLWLVFNCLFVFGDGYMCLKS